MAVSPLIRDLRLMDAGLFRPEWGELDGIVLTAGRHN
jgi:hypothetical protein